MFRTDKGRSSEDLVWSQGAGKQEENDGEGEGEGENHNLPGRQDLHPLAGGSPDTPSLPL